MSSCGMFRAMLRALSNDGRFEGSWNGPTTGVVDVVTGAVEVDVIGAVEDVPGIVDS